MLDFYDDTLTIARTQFALRTGDDALSKKVAPIGSEADLCFLNHLGQGASADDWRNIQAEPVSNILDIVTLKPEVPNLHIKKNEVLILAVTAATLDLCAVSFAVEAGIAGRKDLRKLGALVISLEPFLKPLDQLCGDHCGIGLSTEGNPELLPVFMVSWKHHADVGSVHLLGEDPLVHRKKFKRWMCELPVKQLLVIGIRISKENRLDFVISVHWLFSRHWVQEVPDHRRGSPGYWGLVAEKIFRQIQTQRRHKPILIKIAFDVQQRTVDQSL